MFNFDYTDLENLNRYEIHVKTSEVTHIWFDFQTVLFLKSKICDMIFEIEHLHIFFIRAIIHEHARPPYES